MCEDVFPYYTKTLNPYFRMKVMDKNIRNSTEIEYKWQAHSIRDYKLFLQLTQNLGAKLSKLKKIQIKDLYLDTPENFFLSSHLECRVRLSNGHSELTLKSFTDREHGIFNRNEKTIQLPRFTSKKVALKYCRNKFFRNIQPLFEILNNRRIHSLILPCGTCAEASFDQVLMICGEKKFWMQEIELEFKSGQLDKFKSFVRQLAPLPLNPSKCSKFQVAMGHFLRDSPPFSIDTPNDIADQILKINFEKLKENEADFRKSFNPEAIHNMRVAIRRLRAAIKTFKRIIPAKAKKIRAGLHKLGRILGKKRDLDVFSEFVLHTVNVKSISFQKLARQTEQSQRKILSKLKSNYYTKLVESLEQLKTETSKQNILKLSRNQIRKKLKKVIEIASSIDSKVDDKTLHKLRISIKKLRYICEFFEPIFSKYICSLCSLIEKTKKIQDILGDHQDAIKGISMLIHYKCTFSLEEFLHIQKKYELKKNKTRKLFLKIWNDYWVGSEFHQSQPTTPIELILL